MYYAAIDPMAMILPGDAYLIWVEIHHPHVLKVELIAEVLRSLPPEQRRAAVQRAKTLAAYGQAVERASASIGG